MTPVTRTGPAPAVEVAEAEVEQRVGFLPGPSGDLFHTVHAPSTGATATLVMCPPLLADHPFSYRREVLAAAALARRGVAVWRFHYAGTGYSAGSPAGVSFATLVADAQAVVRAARSATDAPVTVGGTRCGALVAAAAAEGLPLVLWEPVVDGAAFVREGFRARMIADGGQLRRRPPTAAELDEELRREGRVDLLGYSLHERLAASLRGLLLGDVVAAGAGRRVLAIGSGLPRELATLEGSVTTASVGVAEGWWFHRTQQADSPALAEGLAGVISPWLPRSEDPVPVGGAPEAGSAECTFIAAEGVEVFALLTPPSGPPRGEAALLLWGGGGMPAFGRNQVATTLARRLASRGYHVLQVDHPGRGDSPGPEPTDPIDEPSKLAVFAAARAAYAWLCARGLSRVLTIGSCQGAVAALNTADHAPELTGLVLLAPPVAERFEAEEAGGEPCDALSPVHPRMRAAFDRVARSRTPLLIAYGVHDEGFRSYTAAMEGDLGAMLKAAGDRVTETLTDERIHGYMTVSGQEATVDIVLRWLDGVAP